MLDGKQGRVDLPPDNQTPHSAAKSPQNFTERKADQIGGLLHQAHLSPITPQNLDKSLPEASQLKLSENHSPRTSKSEFVAHQGGAPRPASSQMTGLNLHFDHHSSSLRNYSSGHGTPDKVRRPLSRTDESQVIDRSFDIFSVGNGKGVSAAGGTQELADLPYQVAQVDQYGSVSIIWENMLMVILIYNFVTFCYFFAMPSFPFSVWLYLEFLTEILMVLDVIIRFVVLRAIFSHDHKKGPFRHLNMLRNKADEKKLKMSLMILSSMPTSIILYSSLPSRFHPEMWVASIRGLKLYRMSQLTLYFDLRDIRSKKDSIVRTLEALLYILMATHFLACFWLFIGRIDPIQEFSWFRLVMYDQYEVPAIQKYIDSVFFVVSSMTGLGFAYIYPRTNLEYASQSLIMVLGVSLYANFFAFFTVTIYNRNKKRIDNQMRFQESKELAVLRSFPGDMKTSIRNYYNNYRLKFDQLCETYETLKELPTNVRSEMSLFVNSGLIQKVNFFQFAEPDFILRLSKSLAPELALEDSFVVQRGEVATKMYFIKSGIIQVLATDNKTILAFMSDGTYFGEIGILLTQKRTCSIQARSVCVLFTIDKDDLLEALHDFPLHLKYLRSVAKQRLQTTDPEDLCDQQNEEITNELMLQQIGRQHQYQPRDKYHADSTPDHSLLGGATPNIHYEGEKEVPNSIPWNLTDTFYAADSFVIIPFSRLFKVWSLIFLTAFVYNLVYIPFAIGLDFHLPKELIFIDVLAVIIAFCDSLLRPHLAVDKNLEVDLNKTKLLKGYLKHCFAWDVLSSLPLDYILLLLDNSPASPYFRLLRLLKAYRAQEIFSIFQKNTSMNIVFSRLLQLLFAFIICAHWFNCLLLYFARWEFGQGRRFDGKTLLQWLHKNSSVTLPTPDKQSAWELYFNLLVLACCYMGSTVYGDIIPFTISEQTVSIFEMIIGRMFIAFLFAEMSSYVQTQYQAYNEHIQEKTIIMKWIDLNAIDASLKPRIEQYFDLKWNYMKGVKEEELIGDLPQSLRKDVLNYIYEDLIANCEVFPRENQGAITTITEKLQRKLIPKEEYVIRQGELAHDMYFILKGEVRVVTATGVTLATLGKHKHFGEMALIQETASVRSTSIIANTHVQAAVLSRKDFKLICENYPEFKTRMQEIINQRAKDSIKKGVAITNNVQQQVENKELRRFVTQMNFDIKNSSSTSSSQQDLHLRARGQHSDVQLSMIEEESRKDQSFMDTISRSHSLSNSIKRGSKKLRDSSSNGSLDVRSSLALRNSSGKHDMNDLNCQGTQESKVSTFKKRSSQIRRGSLDISQQRRCSQDSNFINRRTSKVLQHELEIIEDEVSKDESGSSKHSMSDSHFRDQVSAEFVHVNQNIGNLQTQTGDLLEESKRMDESRPLSRGSNSIANADQHMFEKSLEENPYKMTPSLRNDPGGISMKDIEKNDETVTPQGALSMLITPRADTMRTLITRVTTSEEPPQQESHPLKNAVKFSSSTSNFDDYLWQFRNHSGQHQASFKLMFSFYAFKYLLVFPLSLYNLVFIPLQMGFSLEFTGWYLFMEIMTIFAYFLDVFYIYRHYRNLKKQQKQSHIVPMDTVTSEYLETQAAAVSNHDYDVIELKLQGLRADLVASIISLFPFSLILQGQTSCLFLVNFCRVLRLVKIFPMYKVLQMLKKYNVSMVRLLEIIISYYVVAHISAGVMLSVGLANKPDVSDTWLKNVPMPLPADLPKQNNSESVDGSTFYIHAIYFTANTISHVAIGDLTTVTLDERILNAFMILCFTFFYSLLFANIYAIFSTENSFLNFNERYQYVKKTLPSDKKLKKQVLQKIDMYFENLWLTTQGYDEASQIFNNLPTQLMHDAFRERYREAFDSAILFKSPKKEGELQTIDNATFNSFIEMMMVRVYMSEDFLVRAGTHDENLYFILDGEVTMIGINNDIIAILGPGTHFNTDLGQGENSRENYFGKAVCHLVCQSITTIAIINKEALGLMYEAFPFWKALIRKLNYHTLSLGKMSLESFVFDQTQHSRPDTEKFEVELKALEDHITHSDDLRVYSKVIKLLDDPKLQYIYDRTSKEYMRLDLLTQHMVIFEEIGLRSASQSLDDAPQNFSKIRRTNSKTVIQLSKIQRSLTFQIEQTSKRSRIKSFCENLYFNRVSTFRTVFEFLQLANTLYIIFAVPFSIAFIEKDQNLTFLIAESVSTAFAFLVILVNLRTPVLYNGGVTLDCKQVLKIYIKKGLLIDIMAALPIDLALGGFWLPQTNRVLWAALRLTRMIAILRIQELIEHFQIHFMNHSILVVSFKALLFLTQLWHWTACAWYFVNLLEYHTYEVTWSKKFDLPNKTISERYLYSMYYVIKIVTGVGQSDMIAYNNFERICFIIMINIGDALFAIAFGLIAQVQMHISENSQFQHFMQKMKQIEGFLINIKALDSQRKRVEEYYSYNFFLRSKKKTLEAEDLKAHLPYSIVQEVIYSVQRDILLPMFKSFKSENMIRDLSYLLKNTVYMPGDYIIVKDQPGEEMYFVIEGQVQVLASDKTTVLKTLGKGSFFGEIAIFMKIKRLTYVTAKTPCIIGILKKQDIEKIVISYPKLGQEFYKEANKRIKETLNMEERKQMQAAMVSVNSSSGSQGQSEDDDMHGSFVNALHMKINNAVDGQSVFSDKTHQSLLRNIKRNSIMMQGMQEYFQQNQPKRQSINHPRLPASPQFGLQVEDLEQPGVSTRQAEQMLIAARNQVGRIEETIDEDPREQEESNRAAAVVGEYRKTADFPQGHQFVFHQQHQQESSSSSLSANEDQQSESKQQNSISHSEQKVTDEDSIGKIPPKVSSNQYLNVYDLKERHDSRSSVSSKEAISSKDLKQNTYKIKINGTEDGGSVTDHEIEQVMNVDGKYLFAKKSMVNRSRMNSANMLPSLVSLKQKQKDALIGEELHQPRKKERRGTIVQLVDQGYTKAPHTLIPAAMLAGHHHTSPVYSKKTKESAKIQGVHRKYSELLFKQALETVKEDPFTGESPRSIGGEGSPDMQPDIYQSPTPMVRSVRRAGKAKKHKRRLSQIQMGKNLLLSNTTGLKLQWTVGQ